MSNRLADRFRRFPVLMGCVAFLSLPVNAGVVTSTDEETGLLGWRFTEGDIEVELIQRLPDQTRGFFLARNFPGDVADEIATNCIFQTIIRNTGDIDSGTTLGVDLEQWRLLHAGSETGIKLKEAWSDSWPEAKVSQAARLAFRWATFPTRQEFRPGDYNWGMTAYGLPPGKVFDLQVHWQSGGQTHSAWMRGIACAPDVERLK